MPRDFEQRVIPYTVEQLYALVADVERYPEFLPWCQSVRVLKRAENEMTAEMVVGFKGLKETFTSIVTLQKPSRITVRYGGGVLKRLTTDWRFEHEHAKDGCVVTFDIDFALRSFLLGGFIDLFFETAFRRMVDAFEKRAKDLYGTKR